MEAIPQLQPRHIAPYTYMEDGRIRSFARGKDKTHGMVSQKFDSLSSYWVSTITGEFDQDISAMWVGPKGSGKSSAVLSASYNCALKVAAWVNDGSKWDEYYNLHELTACILEEEATRLMNIQRKYVIKNYDDIGLGWNARDWQNDENQDKNDVFQINRTDSSIQNLSIPNQFLLDKVPRSLVSHYIEMDQQLFQQGYTTIKLFKPKTMFREGKIINPFLMVDRNKYVNYLIPAPPHELWVEYKKLRAKNKDIAIRRRQDLKVKKDEMRRLEAEIKAQKLLKAQEKIRATDVPQISKLAQKHKDWADKFALWIPEFISMAQKTGKPMNKVIVTVARNHGYHDGNVVAYWRREQLIQKYNLDKFGV